MDRSERKQSDIREKAFDVILVEDDDDSREMLATVLSLHECVVLAVATADAAFDAAHRRLPDVVVTDLFLRVGSAGWTLAQALRADPLTRDVALIAVTGMVAPALEVVAPFDAYLRKPVDLHVLIDLVKHLARVRRSARRHARSAQ